MQKRERRTQPIHVKIEKRNKIEIEILTRPIQGEKGF